jgi:WD40 repeat protein/serine/threonine protein kinase
MESVEKLLLSASTSPEDHLLDLLLDWEELFKQSWDVSPEVMCRDCPELTAELTRRIRLLRNIAWIEMDPPADLIPGNQFDGYEVIRELGRGGRGVTYLVFDAKLNRTIAVKVLLPEFQGHVDDEMRFVAESQITSQLQHPNIVPVHAIGKLEDGRPYLAMKVVQGDTLDKLLAKRPSMSHDLPRFLAIFQQVCQAVAYAHSQRVIHRDLKPANVMVGAFSEVQVMDWGMAKVLNAELASRANQLCESRFLAGSGWNTIRTTRSENRQMSADGMIIGTLEYMAPEQALGELQRVNERADVFGLGAILCEILTGQPPFFGNYARVKRSAQTASLDHAFARLDQSGVDAELIHLAKRCLTAAPEERPASAGEVAVAVTGYLTSIADRLRQAAVTEARIRLAENELDQALGIYSRNEDRTLGMLRMVRALQAAPDDPHLMQQRIIRTNLAAWTAQERRLLAIFDHQGQGGVHTVAFSPDGSKVLTGSSDKTARLWETATGKPLGLPLEHQEAVWAVGFSPNGTKILTVDLDKTARLWETATLKAIGPPLQHQDYVTDVAFSPNGTIVVTTSRDGTARLWESETGLPIGIAFRHQAPISAVAFSPDGSKVLTGGEDATARLWETATGKALGPPLQHKQEVKAVAFSPDGTKVLTGSDDATARLWETATGEAVGPPLKHLGGVCAVAFSPDGTKVLTGSNDRTARLWETATGKALGPDLEHEARVHHLAFSADGSKAITGGSGDKTARLWEASTGKALGPPLQHQDEDYVAVAFSPDGTKVLTASENNTARLWETDAIKALGPTLRHREAISHLAFSPDGTRLLTASKDAAARLWETATGSPLGLFLRHEEEITSVAFSPDGTKVVTGSKDNTARLWLTATANALGPPLQHQNEVTAVAFSPDGTRVLTGSKDNTARLWETTTGKSVREPLEHRGQVWAVAFSPDGSKMLTGSLFSVQLWETVTGNVLGPPMEHCGAWVRAAAFNRDGSKVLTTDWEGARLWETATGNALGPTLEFQGPPQAVAYSPDGTTVVTGGSITKPARLWDAETGNAVGPPLQHSTPWVVAVAFSPDGSKVLTGDRDGTARLWETATGKALGPPLIHEGPIVAVAFSPDGTQLATASEDKTARIWDVPTPLQGDVERIKLWVEVLTGQELDQYGLCRALDAKTWHERRQRLAEWRGPPLP